MKDLLHTLDARAQADLVRSNELTPEELINAAIERIETLNPHVNAIAATAFEMGKAKAQDVTTINLFSGVPTLIKDTNSYPGIPYEMGSRLFKGNIGQQNSQYIEALENEGLIVLGKSTTSELALLGTTETLASGITRNPWNLELSPGGSSGGAVAAVASGMVPVAHASDGGGSIRGPASLTGLFGFKPSRGSTFFSGIPDSLPTAGLISDHCVSRSVRDSEAWFQVTRKNRTKYSPIVRYGKKKLKIGYFLENSFGNLPSEEVRVALKETVKICRDLGHELIEVHAPKYQAMEASEIFFALSGKIIDGLIQQMKHYMGASFNESLLEPYTLALWNDSHRFGTELYQESHHFFSQATHDLNIALDSFDVLLSPTTPFPAFKLGEFSPSSPFEKLKKHTTDIASYTVLASIAGWPAMTVPLYWTSNNLPIGSHFAAKFDNDDLLFDLAIQLEEARPWANIQNKRIGELLCLKS